MHSYAHVLEAMLVTYNPALQSRAGNLHFGSDSAAYVFEFLFYFILLQSLECGTFQGDLSYSVFF